MDGRKNIIFYLVLLKFCLNNSAWSSKTKFDKFEKVWSSGEQFCCSPKDLDKYLRRMVFGKQLTFAADLDKYPWKQASVADLVEYLHILSCGKMSVSSIAMYRFLKKKLSVKRPEINEYNKSSGDFLKEKKSFASFRWRPVDGKTFVLYI